MSLPRSLLLAGLGGAVAGGIVTALALRLGAGTPGPRPEPDRQAAVHDMGAHVMPFDLKKTLHVFEMTHGGGVQDVVARDSTDHHQVMLIRQHLRDEASRFQAGDYSDPASLHGRDMPGLAELAAAAGRVEVAFSDLPTGARLTFTASDPRLVTALHRWFGAQLSDHGADATYR
jgi:hypothetical protein